MSERYGEAHAGKAEPEATNKNEFGVPAAVQTLWGGLGGYVA